MARLLGSTVLVLVLGTVVSGQPARPVEVSCPVDGCHFQMPTGEQGDQAGGTDSDQCPHDRQGQTLPHLLMVCPRCNFAAARGEFAVVLSEEQKQMLLRGLATSPYRGVTDGLTEIPGWERYRLAAKCAELMGQEKEQTNYLMYAAWSARVEACRAATVAYSSPLRMIAPIGRRLNEWMSTRAITDVIREIEQKAATAPTPAEKGRLMLHLAMMHQRAGSPAKRDKVLTELIPLGGSQPLLAARVRRFKELVVVETAFQEQLVDLVQKRVEKVDTRWERTTLTYLLADALRRLGRDAEAVARYRAARKLMTEPTQTRLYTDHFLSILAPGEPLPTPVPEEEPERKSWETEENPVPSQPGPETPAPAAPKESAPKE